MLLSDPRLITGLLKEALFSEKTIFIESIAGTHSALLENIEDDSPRVLKARKVFFLKVAVPNELISRFIVNLRVDFSKFSVLFKNSEIISINGSRCEVSCPSEAVISNRRSVERTPFPDNLTAEVIVQSEGMHSRAIFTANDHSANFIGGFLKVRPDQTINNDTTVHGRVPFGKVYLDVYAQVSAYVLVETSEENCVYRVALQSNSEKKSGASLTEVGERRLHGRVTGTTPMTIRDPHTAGLEYVGTIIDCSLSGFSWEPSSPEMAPFFAVGTVVETEKPRLKVRFLGHRKSNVFAFEIAKAAIDDRQAWMEILNYSSGLNYKVPRLQEADKLLSLFIESGALATGYVNANKGFSKTLRGTLSQHSPHLSGLLHRWKLGASDGTGVDTTASAFRVSEAGWMIGDIAAKISTDSEKPKLNRNAFVHSFISSFGRFCETLTPCPEVSILFLETHPFWKDFVSHIERNKFEDTRITRISYLRYTSKTEISSKLKYSKIHGKNWDTIKKMSATISGAGVSPSIVDARIDIFGSPILAMLFEKFSFDFERRYFEISGGCDGYLVINKFSPAITLNQTVNCAWFFPKKKISGDQVISVRELSKKLSLEIGSAAPGLIVPTDMIETKEGSKSSLLISGPPSVFLGFFGELDEVA